MSVGPAAGAFCFVVRKGGEVVALVAVTPEWETIRRRYETTDITMAALADEYGINQGTMRKRKSREKWCKLPGVETKPRPKRAVEPRDIKRIRLPIGGPVGNKKAVKTGEYETIYADALEPDEYVLYHGINTDKLAQLNEEIRLMTIRERRMLQRIADLMGEDFTVVEKQHEKGMGAGQFGPVPVDKESEKEHGTLGQIQRIEEALTRVQLAKAKLLSLKYKIESNQEPGTGDVKGYIEALEGTGAEVWANEEEEVGDES